MAAFYENLQANKTSIANEITRYGVPELAKLMLEKKLITKEEKFQILAQISTEKANNLLYVVENNYCLKKFIRILYKCRLRDCADLIKGKY